jgi:hypothetical protein
MRGLFRQPRTRRELLPNLLSDAGCNSHCNAGRERPGPQKAEVQVREGLEDLAFMAGWNEGKVDGLDAVLTPSFIRRSPGGMNADGVVLDESYHMKDVSFHLWTHSGTNTGPGTTPATGKSSKVSGMTLFRYQDGKIAAELVKFDVLDWYTQLGYPLAPPASAAAALAAAPAPKK